MGGREIMQKKPVARAGGPPLTLLTPHMNYNEEMTGVSPCGFALDKTRRAIRSGLPSLASVRKSSPGSLQGGGNGWRLHPGGDSATGSQRFVKASSPGRLAHQQCQRVAFSHPVTHLKS